LIGPCRSRTSRRPLSDEARGNNRRWARVLDLAERVAVLSEVLASASLIAAGIASGAIELPRSGSLVPRLRAAAILRDATSEVRGDIRKLHRRDYLSKSPESVSMRGGVGAPEVKSSGQVTVTEVWPKGFGN
jgi:hypothetical protein